jgi:hypothetical protein
VCFLTVLLPSARPCAAAQPSLARATQIVSRILPDGKLTSLHACTHSFNCRFHQVEPVSKPANQQISKGPSSKPPARGARMNTKGHSVCRMREKNGDGRRVV